ncbi:MAG TPA: transferrin receptor-like dimerization domain-containing protein [Woeseiaceae bacterium]|nr:transferrin receptor-like dimerization domain-containing protein [Woeseiaceae bacterium]
MKVLLGALLMPAAFAFAAANNAEGESGTHLAGFDEETTGAQRELEKAFDEDISAADQDEWLRHLSAKPHHVGSRAGRENARYIADLFESWGYDVEIEEYEILLPTPATRELELVAPHTYTALLEEDALPEDPSTSVRDELLPPYNAFSTDGEVEGELVFVNYGIPGDYELLERHGIDVRGKIAIAKYGRSWRGIKPKLAGEKGAIGTIIYSDPADDGYAQGDAYPKGPFKHESAVQRGSVMDMPTYPGDVLTPGIGATKSAKRLTVANSPTITKIPVLPISQRDALPLLAALDGAVVPAEWRGALPITYHLGPGPARVRLKVSFNWNRVTAYNVIARLDGAKWPDEWIIRGNHHDGWNHGAADPVSGLVAMLSEAKAVAALAEDGIPPARTIVYAAWDAEEPGLIGSTEWAEHHADELREHAVAYLNTDSNSRGFVSIGGSHVLERFLNQVADDVIDPQTGLTLKERRRKQLVVNASDGKARDEAEKREDLRIYPMGSGSDYTPFLQHLGVASANLGFGGEGGGGSYHTLYDTYEHYTTWRDPGLVYGVALSKVGGRATLRLANAPRLPFEFTGFADNVALYVTQLEELADSMREETALNNRLLENGAYDAALDPTMTLGPPAHEQPVPHFNFAPLQNALTRLQEAAAEYEEVMSGSTVRSSEINELLYTSERLLTREEGLMGRPWYKHHIYAPGFYTGYGVKTIPGVREAIEQRDYEAVGPQIALVAEVLNDIADRIETIAAMGLE